MANPLCNGSRVLGEEVQLIAGLEAHRFAWGDGNFGSGAWVAADAGLAGLDSEDAEATEFDAVSGDERLFHAVEDGVNRSLCLGSWQTGALNNPLYQVLLNHVGRRP